jgi:hypothetical protein
MNKTCGNCRFWSDRLARVEDREVVAMCLNTTSMIQSTYTSKKMTCAAWVDAPYGAIDEPGNERVYAPVDEYPGEVTDPYDASSYDGFPKG